MIHYQLIISFFFVYEFNMLSKIPLLSLPPPDKFHTTTGIATLKLHEEQSKNLAVC